MGKLILAGVGLLSLLSIQFFPDTGGCRRDSRPCSEETNACAEVAVPDDTCCCGNGVSSQTTCDTPCEMASCCCRPAHLPVKSPPETPSFKVMNPSDGGKEPTQGAPMPHPGPALLTTTNATENPATPEHIPHPPLWKEHEALQL